ncbi:MAG: ankyrin repeat domain-containing protein, partial [bacterium]
ERFSQCIKILIEAGAKFKDKPVLSVLLGDAGDLKKQVKKNPSIVQAKYTLPHAFTPLEDVTLLHFCAEFNKVACAKVLIEHDADVNAKAAVDDNGLGGQTPIFHTVNSYNNFAYPMLELLLKNGASLDIHLKGLLWGKAYEWETYIPEVNPISYAMMGNLPQFQRKVKDIAKNIELMQKFKYSKTYRIQNVPNVYLSGFRKLKKKDLFRILDW